MSVGRLALRVSASWPVKTLPKSLSPALFSAIAPSRGLTPPPYTLYHLREMLSHLRNEGISFSQRRANGQALFQLFFHDPNGIKIELNFDAAEAEGIEPELMASDLIKTIP